ncbi:MAG: ATP-binding cassette domain-containing protein, partial [Actinomycetia bacterium]|nr:ATP-binding cassette domain-containing protein [Actinomycetes bacterium]
MTANHKYRLVIDNITKRYDDQSVVEDLSFTVEPGRITGFLGPNGSGKSTTMKVLLDLAAADHGTANIGGCRYRDLADPAGTVGVVLEPNAFHPGRSGRNHLRVLAQATNQPLGRVDEHARGPAGIIADHLPPLRVFLHLRQPGQRHGLAVDPARMAV